MSSVIKHHDRKSSNQEKKKTEGKEKDVEISSVVLKAMKHCLIFNGFICLFENVYRKINDEEETNPDIVLILNFLFFFYYCVALSVMLLSGLEIPFNAMAIIKTFPHHSGHSSFLKFPRVLSL